jgi:collagen type VI alpha
MTTGLYCERSCSGLLDLGIVLDSSGSINSIRFEKVKQMVISVVEQLDVRLDRTRVGVVYWSQTAWTWFTMLDYSDNKQDVVQAIRNIPFVGNRTHTADALRLLYNVLFQPANGERAVVPNVAIVVTDGNSNIEPDQTPVEAANCRRRNIRLVVAGVGDFINEMELQMIASRPLDANLFVGPSYNITGSNITQALVRATCDDINECDPNPCQNGGTCIDGYMTYYCNCPQYRAGANCTITCTTRLDVVLVLDISGSVIEEYNLVMDFSRMLVAGLDIDSDSVRVGVVTFDTTVTNEIRLDRYIQQPRGLNEALNFIHDLGRTNTQAALHAMRTDIFGQFGDRSDVANVGILVSDGYSNVNSSNTIPEAALAKSSAISMLSVVINPDHNITEMNLISSTPLLDVFLLTNATYLSDVVEKVLSRLCSGVF